MWTNIWIETNLRLMKSFISEKFHEKLIILIDYYIIGKTWLLNERWRHRGRNHY
jgi:hypothetical protein